MTALATRAKICALWLHCSQLCIPRSARCSVADLVCSGEAECIALQERVPKNDSVDRTEKRLRQAEAGSPWNLHRKCVLVRGIKASGFSTLVILFGFQKYKSNQHRTCTSISQGGCTLGRTALM